MFAIPTLTMPTRSLHPSLEQAEISMGELNSVIGGRAAARLRSAAEKKVGRSL
jgi:hypothetical protein